MKEWDMIYENDALKYLKNINIDEIINLILLFDDDFKMDDDIFLTKENIYEILYTFKDVNTVFKKDQNIIVGDFYDIGYSYYRDPKVKNDGNLSLFITLDEDDENSVLSIEISFFADYWCFTILCLRYDTEKEIYCLD
jgi:hypothetical protein